MYSFPLSSRLLSSPPLSAPDYDDLVWWGEGALQLRKVVEEGHSLGAGQAGRNIGSKALLSGLSYQKSVFISTLRGGVTVIHSLRCGLNRSA